MEDPFAAYGGQAHQPTADPFAAYGGAAHDAPQAAPAKPDYDTSLMDAVTQKGYDASKDKRPFLKKLWDDVGGNPDLPLEQRGPMQRTMDYMMGHTTQGVSDIGQGNYAKGTNEVIKGASPMAIPFLPSAVVEAPVASGVAAAGGYVTGKTGKAIAQAGGATPDQQELAENVGNLVGGYGAYRAAKAAPGVFSATKDFISKVNSIDPKLGKDLLGVMSPRLAHLQSAASKVMELPNRISAVNEAINAPNAAAASNPTFTPSSPSVRMIDVPNYAVQPSGQPINKTFFHQNAVPSAKPSMGSSSIPEFTVNPPEVSQPLISEASSQPLKPPYSNLNANQRQLATGTTRPQVTMNPATPKGEQPDLSNLLLNSVAQAEANKGKSVLEIAARIQEQLKANGWKIDPKTGSITRAN
jgi:hypothetical protein